MQLTPQATKQILQILDGLSCLVDEALKNCGTGAGGFQPGNTCWQGGDGGSDGAAGSRVLFEVAPNPDDAELSGRWNSLSEKEKVTISDLVAKKILPEVFQAVGVKAELHSQFGGYENDTNPSFAAIVASDTPAQDVIDVAKMAGFALSQKSMMVVSETPFDGADEVGLITVSLPKDVTMDDVHSVYKQLREIDNGVIQGHTTVEGQMMIVNFSGDNENLAEKVNDRLSGDYTVKWEVGYCAFPQEKDYDYASGTGVSGLSSRGEDAREFRQEASRLIDAELKRRGKAAGQGTEKSVAGTSGAGGEADGLKNCGTGAGGFQPGNTCARGGDGGSGFDGEPPYPDGVDTESQYRHKDGTWDEKRQKLHDSIIAPHFEGKTPVDKPVAYLMGGGPASGKSVAVKAGLISIPDNVVHIDPDEIKGKIPEYKQRLAAKDSTAAAFAHEESSYLSKQVLAKAAKESYNFMLDGTGDSGLKSLEAKVASMRAKGAKVVANYLTVDVDEALRRNELRAQKTGRKPPESFVRETHKTISQVLPEAIKRGLFDEFKLIDTNDGKNTIVATAIGKELTIHDTDLWQRFLAKGRDE